MFDQKKTLQIPISFFEWLKELRVLSLSQIWFEILPSSLLSLEKLQTLYLAGTVKDVTIIGELKNLKIHSLSLKNFEQLPKEIGHLTHLQLLEIPDSTDTIIFDTIPYFTYNKVICRLKTPWQIA